LCRLVNPKELTSSLKGHTSGVTNRTRQVPIVGSRSSDPLVLAEPKGLAVQALQLVASCTAKSQFLSYLAALRAVVAGSLDHCTLL
jgi:hypothetical protein